MLKACRTACPDILYPDELKTYPERILLNLYGYWYGRGSLLWSSTSKYVQTFPESHFAVFKYWNSLVLRSRSRYVPAFLDCPFAASKIGKSLVLHSRSLHSSLVRLLVALLRVALDYYCNADLFVRPSSPRPKLHLLSRPARLQVLKHTDTQTDRQADRQTDRQTDRHRHTYRLTDQPTDRQTERHTISWK